MSTSEPKQFRAVIAAFLLTGIEFGGEIVHFEFPFANNLIEGLLFLFGGVGDRGCAIHFDL